MVERVFTIFEGPDAGRQFVLRDRPITFGREEGRDVVLHDDRASRLHARLIPEPDGVLLVDANSSNGTFVNGALIRERRVFEGDIISIGNNRIIFGREPPSPERIESLAAPARVPTGPPGGAVTHILADASALPKLNRVPARLTEVLEEVVEAARPAAAARGFHLRVEREMHPDRALVDIQHLYRALAGLIGFFLEMWPATNEGARASRIENPLVLRLSPDPVHDGFQIEIICIGATIPREAIRARLADIPVVTARHVAVAHGGSLQLLPPDAPDLLARLCMPLGAQEDLRETMISPNPPKR